MLDRHRLEWLFRGLKVAVDNEFGKTSSDIGEGSADDRLTNQQAVKVAFDGDVGVEVPPMFRFCTEP